MKYRVIIEADEDGGFVVSCPALPGCWSRGETRDEAIRNITEAAEAYIESLEKHGDPVPAPITEAIIEVNTGKAA